VKQHTHECYEKQFTQGDTCLFANAVQGDPHIIHHSSRKGETATGGGPSVKIGDQSDPIDTVVIANLYQAISDFFLLPNASSFLGGKIFAT